MNWQKLILSALLLVSGTLTVFSQGPGLNDTCFTRPQVDYLLKRNVIATTLEKDTALLHTENKALKSQVGSLQKSSKADSTIAANKTEEFMICNSRLATKEGELEKETGWKKFWKATALIAVPVAILETTLIYFTLKQ